MHLLWSNVTDDAHEILAMSPVCAYSEGPKRTEQNSLLPMSINNFGNAHSPVRIIAVCILSIKDSALKKFES